MTSTIFTAAKIVTMNRYLPEAQAVLVEDGMILCVGTVDECRMWRPDADVDNRFREHVLVPGFVEAHGHTAQGALAPLPHVGYFDFPLPDGSVAPGVKSYEELQDRLNDLNRSMPEGEMLFANGFDPIFFAGEPRLTREHLDAVSTTRQIVIRHASGHLLTVNSKVLEDEGITADSPTPGVDIGPDGTPSGELQEPPAMMLAKTALAHLMKVSSGTQGVVNYGKLCRDAGVTTSSELAGMMLIDPSVGPAWQEVAEAEGFPLRLVMYNIAAVPGSAFDPAAAVSATIEARDLESDRFRIGGIKSILDGSLQGWTAKMLHPYYMTGTDHGQVTEDPDRLVALFAECNRRKVNVQVHVNGNGVGDMMIEAVESALLEAPWLDHRHTLTHSQTTTRAQYRKMARLGIPASIFANHIYYWGDQHYSQTMGPEITRRMWAGRTALDEGVVISLHSDAGVTPVGMLMPMWCSVNRVTVSGRELGTHERITPYEALEAVTLGAAYQMHMDHEIGSIEAGKRADFAVLSDDPLTVDPMEIRNIEVWGTVLSGVPSQKGS